MDQDLMDIAQKLALQNYPLGDWLALLQDLDDQAEKWQVYEAQLRAAGWNIMIMKEHLQEIHLLPQEIDLSNPYDLELHAALIRYMLIHNEQSAKKDWIEWDGIGPIPPQLLEQIVKDANDNIEYYQKGKANIFSAPFYLVGGSYIWAKDIVEGTIDAIRYYEETLEALQFAIDHPEIVIDAALQELITRYQEEFVEGDLNSKAFFVGNVLPNFLASYLGGKKMLELISKSKKAKALDSHTSNEKDLGEKNIDEDATKGTAKVIDDLDIIDGKVLGKISINDFKAIRTKSIHNADKPSMVLGKYEGTKLPDGTIDWTNPGPNSYIAKAGKDSMYFDLGAEWNTIKTSQKLTDKDMFDLFNVPALNDAVKGNKTIKFSHDPRLPEYADSFLDDEWNYLKNKFNYTTLVKEGEFWIARN